jgi:hypothetical protein
MLTHRTNVLFSADEHNLLLALSREHGKTMGELIRQAVKKTYKKKKVSSLAASFKRIKEITKNVDTKGIDYRAMAIEGRRYED